MLKLKIASLFAGVGGLDLGFELTGKYKTVFANEADKNAGITFSKNFDCRLKLSDIRTVEESDVPDIDVLLSGFPCTSFSVAGYRKGFEDENSGDLFFETLRFITSKRPKAFLLENVKNLVGHDGGKTFRIISEALIQNGYFIKPVVLNAKEYSHIPQNRERIYIAGFESEEHANRFNFPLPDFSEKRLSDFVDFESKVEDKYYYTEESCSFYSQLKETIKSKNTFYQWRRKYVRENKSKVCPTLTANMGTGGHNVPLILSKYGIRKLTPRECFNLQGFPQNFILPDIAMSHLYKQAGNSVVVPIVQKIAENMYKAIT